MSSEVSLNVESIVIEVEHHTDEQCEYWNFIYQDGHVQRVEDAEQARHMMEHIPVFFTVQRV